MKNASLRELLSVHQILWFLFYLCIACLFLSYPLIQNPNAWYASFWLFDYESGFIKRGFIGYILNSLCGDECRTFSVVTDLSFLTLYLLTLTLCIFAFVVFRKNKWLGVIFLAAGFSIQQFAHDIGRLDQVNYLLFFICLLAIWKLSNTVLLFAFLLVMSSIMMLIHEAALFIQIPALLSIILLRFSETGRVADFTPRQLTIIWMIVLSLVFLFVIASGNVNPAKAGEIQSRLLTVDGFSGPYVDEVKDAVWVQTSSVRDNIELTMSKALKMKTVSRLLMILAVSLPILFILVSAVRQMSQGNCYLFAALALPLLGALPLFITGCDWYRWIAMVFFNWMIILGFSLLKWRVELKIHKAAIVSALVFSIYSGPYGITHALPERKRVIESFEQYSSVKVVPEAGFMPGGRAFLSLC